MLLDGERVQDRVLSLFGILKFVAGHIP
jgi:hypothetical protein